MRALAGARTADDEGQLAAIRQLSRRLVGTVTRPRTPTIAPSTSQNTRLQRHRHYELMRPSGIGVSIAGCGTDDTE